MNLKDAVKMLLHPGIRGLAQPRRFQCYVVGAEKTGTTTMADVFARSYRSVHEPRWVPTVASMFGHFSLRVSDNAFARSLRRRDRVLWLEAESSCLMGYCARFLAPIFPDARFVLTVRPWRSWLKSVVNHHLTHKRDDHSMNSWYAIAYEPHRFDYHLQDHPLENRGLFAVRSYLTYWRKSIAWVVDSVPQDRLLILRTHELSQSTAALEQFVGLPKGILGERESIASNTAPRDHSVFDLLDPLYLEDCAETLCGEYARLFIA